jgi:glutamate dehydrogenase/leucine dehydrogenase
VISGFGNVAWGAALKAVELGAKVIAIDSRKRAFMIGKYVNFNNIIQ